MAQQEPITKTKLKLKDIVRMGNVAEKLSQQELDYYGNLAVTGYNVDRGTRTDWESRHAKAIKLVLQVVEKKSFPWVGASNVKFPLVTIAALQFLARISVLTKGRNLVKVEAWGADPDGKKSQRADRISTHMSYQLLEEDSNWLDDDEQAKFSAAILGCAIKKSFHDSIEGINHSPYIPLMDFVVDYHCKDLDTAQRATHRLDMFPNRIQENVTRGLFVKMMPDAEAPLSVNTSANQLAAASDDASGLTKQVEDSLRPFSILEQHCWLDLDGDGYAEPYVMFVREDTKQVLRIVARFFDEGDVFRKNDSLIRDVEAKAKEAADSQTRSLLEKKAQELEDAPGNTVIRIVPTTHFTKYPFIPAPDGSFYCLGLGTLLGPTNAAVDSLMNQIIDAGTMLTTSGGFLGRGVKIKGGKQSFDPFEWKPVDGAGDDLRKNIVPLPVNPPNEVLFNLLGLLIQYGEKIGSATDIMTGVSPGQNTPAETSRNTIEQGMMLFSGIYTRMYRAFGAELKKLYRLNRWYFKQSPHFDDLTKGDGALVAPDDYDSNIYRIFPAADATAVSSGQKQQKAKFVFDVATASPSGFDQYQVRKRLLEAYDVDGIEQIFPNPKGPNAIQAAANPKVELEKAKLAQDQAQHEDNMGLEIARLRGEMSINDAKIIELESKAKMHMANATGVEAGHQIAMIDAQIGAAKLHRDGLTKVLDTLQRAHEGNRKYELEKAKIGDSNGKTTKPK